MEDELEAYIKNHRNAFEEGNPAKRRTWNHIEQSLDKRQPSFNWVWKVAAVLFLTSTIYLTTLTLKQEVEPAQLSAEFKEAEDYYISLIQSKKVEISKKLSPADETAFIAEIDQLDSMYNELKVSYTANAANERVVDAMISNLQLRLEILTRQLEILETINQRSYETQSTIEI